MSLPAPRQKPEEARLLFRKIAVFFFSGQLITTYFMASKHFLDLPGAAYWGGRALGIGFVCYAAWLISPLIEAEKKKTQERKENERAELEAAHLFLFGTKEMPRLSDSRE